MGQCRCVLSGARLYHGTALHWCSGDDADTQEYGFLFASSVLAAGKVFLVGVLSATVIIWSLDLAPAHWGQ
ncbi:MAG: hypothetical protein ACREVK_12245 [Gammaproteobacteria bacterium]